jgi:aspartate oxidase
MKKSDLKKHIKENIKSILATEVTVVDKNTKPEEVKDEDPLTVKTAINTAKKSNKPVSIAEKEDDEEEEKKDDWYKSKDEDGDKDKEPSKSELKKDAKATKGIAKAKDELASLTREMKSLAKKYKEATGAEKDKIVADLKAKTKLKKELEAILDK